MRRLLKFSLLLLVLGGCSENGTEAEQRVMRDACEVEMFKDKPQFAGASNEAHWIGTMRTYCWNVAEDPSLLDRLRY